MLVAAVDGAAAVAAIVVVAVVDIVVAVRAAAVAVAVVSTAAAGTAEGLTVESVAGVCHACQLLQEIFGHLPLFGEATPYFCSKFQSDWNFFYHQNQWRGLLPVFCYCCYWKWLTVVD